MIEIRLADGSKLHLTSGMDVDEFAMTARRSRWILCAGIHIQTRNIVAFEWVEEKKA